MFAKQFRLPALEQLRNSTWHTTPLFNLRLAKNDLGINRYGFVVSKKIDKRATGRNHLKRRFRGCLEVQHATLPSGYDALFILKVAAVPKTTNELDCCIQEILKKVLLV